VESNERSFKKIILHLAMVATKRWPPIQVAATPVSHRRQAVDGNERSFKKIVHHLAMVATKRCGDLRKAAIQGRPPSGDGGHEEFHCGEPLDCL
jgi:hypothetical protein